MQNKQSLITNLSKTVQHNCHVADASHAGDYTLCIYLLKMRELYRWENNKPFSTILPNAVVGKWLKQREKLWNDLEGSEYLDIDISNKTLSPFESDSINDTLHEHQLVYSGGMGINNRPHFFLADLNLHEQHNDYSLYVAGKEYARDMSAPPAMSHQNNIYIRKESFRRLLWEQLETWRWNKPDNALGRAFACYDCDNNLDAALAEMTDTEVKNVIEHERGEIQAGELLGEEWRTLLFTLPHSKAAIMLRAVRDHLADSLTTLPALLSLNSAPSWHFYFGNLNNMRKDLYPSLIKGYDEWIEAGSLSKMTEIVEHGKEHWLALCQEILKINEPDLKSQQSEIQNLIENNRL
ncbi:MAG: hypothetical protein OQK75_00195 [Gammaproteobacteria bacterium]|nr:hypothetical protein [Gammaproteobacteria bacterium]MCW8986063.1 hypothetical protein [Gammaproteobacteria bacterium]